MEMEEEEITMEGEETTMEGGDLEMEAGKIEMGQDKIGLVAGKTTELTMEDRENNNNKRQLNEVEVVEETIGQEDRQARVQAMSYRCV